MAWLRAKLDICPINNRSPSATVGSTMAGKRIFGGCLWPWSLSGWRAALSPGPENEGAEGEQKECPGEGDEEAPVDGLPGQAPAP